MSTLKVALDALKGDSGRWSDVSTALGTAATNASGAYVAAEAFPTCVSSDLGGMYSQLQDKVATLLTQGGTQAQGISDELTHVGTVINGADDQAKHDIASAWDYN